MDHMHDTRAKGKANLMYLLYNMQHPTRYISNNKK